MNKIFFCFVALSLISTSPANAAEKKKHARVTASASNFWGGEGIEVNVAGDSARILLFCASGTVESGWSIVDNELHANGTLRAGRGVGPGHSQDVAFSGKVDGKKMDLVISSNPEEHFQLTRGQHGNVAPCNLP